MQIVCTAYKNYFPKCLLRDTLHVWVFSLAQHHSSSGVQISKLLKKIKKSSDVKATCVAHNDSLPIFFWSRHASSQTVLTIAQGELSALFLSLRCGSKRYAKSGFQFWFLLSPERLLTRTMRIMIDVDS